ncbi:MAG: type IV pilin protein [Deltaproteobacteria bacterium]
MNRKGFTLIELLIVVVIIGILAAIAIPKFASTKQKAYVASMKADLKNLATAQEAYFADSLKYMAGTASNITGSTAVGLPTGCALGTTCLYVPSAGVTVAVAATVSPAEWQASTTHIAATTGTECDMFIGATTIGVATVEGEPACK